jgi:NADPH2:quinone reductase
MLAVVLRETGGPDVLVPTEVPIPTAAPGQILVKIDAIGVSAGETQLRSGAIAFPLPAILGAEAAGTVEQLGDGVDPALLGARVVAVTGGVGSYAEYVAVDVNRTARIPDGLSTVDAIASAAPGALATALLATAAPTANETVLVEGGSGKVGGYLVAHAHQAKARVVATAGTAAGRDRATTLGADIVVDHSDPDWPDRISAALDGGTVDAAFEMVGGTVAGRLLSALTEGTGRMLLYGRLSGHAAELDSATIMRSGLRIIGCGGLPWFNLVLGTHYPRFVDLLATGQTHRLHIDAELPLADAAEAHHRIENHTVTGRIVLRPPTSGTH